MDCMSVYDLMLCCEVGEELKKIVSYLDYLQKNPEFNLEISNFIDKMISKYSEIPEMWDYYDKYDFYISRPQYDTLVILEKMIMEFWKRKMGKEYVKTRKKD